MTARHTTSAVATGSSPETRSGFQAATTQTDAEGDAEGPQMAGVVRGQAGVGAEEQGRERDAELQQTEQPDHEPEPAVVGVARGSEPIASRIPGVRSGTGGAGRDAHLAVQRLRAVPVGTAVGTAREVGVDHVRGFGGVLAVEGRRDRELDSVTDHVRVVDHNRLEVPG